MPRFILPTQGADLIPVKSISGKVSKGEPLCMSGGHSGKVRHGQALGETGLYWIPKDIPGNELGAIAWPDMYEPEMAMEVEEGDSGGPVYRCGTGQVVGLLSTVEEGRPFASFAPMLPPEEPTNPELALGHYKADQAPGIVHADKMGNIHIAFAP